MDYRDRISDALWLMGFGWLLITIFVKLYLKCCSRNPNHEASQSADRNPQHQLQQQQLFLNPELAITFPIPPTLYDERRAAEIAAACTGCAICLGEYGGDDDGGSRRTLKPCGHRFHQACIEAWFHKDRRCPICRGPSWEVSSSVRVEL